MSQFNINGARQNTLSRTLGKGRQMTKVSTLTGKLNQSNGINRRVGSTFPIKTTSLKRKQFGRTILKCFTMVCLYCSKMRWDQLM